MKNSPIRAVSSWLFSANLKAAATVLAFAFVPSAAAGTTQTATFDQLHGSDVSAQNPRAEYALGEPSPQFPGISKSVVWMHSPLQGAGAKLPAECQRIAFYRYRLTQGPTSPLDTDAVLVTQPGAMAGASSLEMNALATIRFSKEKGKSIEYWALDRRGNCLEDHRGIEAANRAQNPQVAVDYYWGKKALPDGSKFKGFDNSPPNAAVNAISFDQILDDEFLVISQGLPSREFQKTKVFCGGHSYGSPMTAAFASSKFADYKGYEMCGGGTFALDMIVTADPLALRSMPLLRNVTKPLADGAKQLEEGIFAFNMAPASMPLLPEATSMLATIANAARFHPTDDSSWFRNTPVNPVFEVIGRLLQSTDLASAVAPQGNWQKSRLTNQALLGTWLDDNSQPLMPLGISAGIFDSPVQSRDLPIPNFIASEPFKGTFPVLADFLSILLKAGNLAVPKPTDQLIGWKNFDQLAGQDFGTAPNGRPFASPNQEVTNINDVARVVSDQPLDFTEWFFPNKSLVDYLMRAAGSGEMPYTQQMRALPNRTLSAGQGAAGPVLKLFNSTLDLVDKENIVDLPEYNHLDVLTAAPIQNDGSKEKGALALAEFVTANQQDR